MVFGNQGMQVGYVFCFYRVQVDYVMVYVLFEVAIWVIDIGDIFVYVGCEIFVGIVQYDYNVFGYIFVFVVVNVFYYGFYVGVVYCKLFVCYIIYIGFFGCSVVESYVVDDDIVICCEFCILVGYGNELCIGKAFFKVVVCFVFQVEGQAGCFKSCKILFGRVLEVELYVIFWQFFVVMVFINFIGEYGICGMIGILDVKVGFYLVVLIDSSLCGGYQLVVQYIGNVVILFYCFVLINVFICWFFVENRVEVQFVVFLVGGFIFSFEYFYFVDHFVECMEVQVCYNFLQVFSQKVEEINYVFWFVGKVFLKFWVLCGNVYWIGIYMVFVYYDIIFYYQGSCSYVLFFCV